MMKQLQELKMQVFLKRKPWTGRLFHYKRNDIIKTNDFGSVCVFVCVFWGNLATEQPLKIFVCTQIRAESMDRQPLFYYKATARITNSGCS